MVPFPSCGDERSELSASDPPAEALASEEAAPDPTSAEHLSWTELFDRQPAYQLGRRRSLRQWRTPEEASQTSREREAIAEVAELRREGCPIEYILAQVERLGPQLHNTALSTRIELPPSAATALPARLTCHPTTAPSSSASASPPASDLAAPPPTCILNISFRLPEGSSNMLVPAHSLLFALHAPVFRQAMAMSAAAAAAAAPPPAEAHAASDAESDSGRSSSSSNSDTLRLPLYSIKLPCALAFEAFYRLVHHGALPDSIRVPAVAPPADPSASHEQRAADHIQHLLGQANFIYAVWQNLRTLAWEDERCWRAVEEAWDHAGNAVGVAEAQRAARDRAERTASWVGR